MNPTSKTQRSIKKRILVTTIFLMIVSIGTIGVVSEYVLAKNSQDLADALLPNIAGAAAQSINKNLKAIRNTLETAAALIDLQASTWDKQREFLNTLKKNYGFDRVALIDLNGNAQFSDYSTIDVSDRDYFLGARNGQFTISKAFRNRINQLATLAFAAPILNREEVSAVLMAGINLDWFSKDIKALNFGQTGFVFVVDREGGILAHPDQAQALKLRNPIEEAKSDPAQESYARLIRRMISSEGNRYEEMIDGQRRLTYYRPIPETNWVLGVTITTDELFDNTVRLGVVTGVLSVVLIFLGSLIALLLTGSITRPLNQAIGVLQNLAQGEGDLTRRITVNSQDEIQVMADLMNQTLEKVAGLVRGVRTQAERLTNVGEELSSNIIQTSAAIREISANIQSVNNQVINQSSSVTETSTTMEEINASVNSLHQLIETQTQSVNQASTAIEEMIASIRQVSETLKVNEQNMHQLNLSAGEGREVLNKVTSEIRAIAQESEELLEISKIIRSISSQTNLLAMNAAIEAAHAGDYGRGFAVVASEVRKLAESSGEQAKTVGRVLKHIRSAIDGIARSADDIIEKFESIEQRIRLVSDQEVSIAHSMREQNEGSLQVLQEISRLKEVSTTVRNSAQEMQVGSHQILKETSTLRDITHEIGQAMREMANGAQEMAVAMETVNSLTASNKNSIEALDQELSKFQV